MNVRKLRDYRKMMEDDLRMDAYQEAIRKVCPGKVVCEIGVGLGPLSLLALKAGAARVYGIELDKDALEGATAILKANGYGSDRFIPIHGLSTNAQLPEKVDVLLSETLDSMGIGENTARYMVDARERFLHPDGVFLPARLTCFAALAHPKTYQSRTDFWGGHLSARYGMDYSLASAWERDNKHTFQVQTDELVSDWTTWQEIDFSDPASYQPVTQLLFPVTSEGIASGLSIVFDAELTEGVHLKTFPEDPYTHWEQSFVAFPDPIDVNTGNGVYVELDITQSDQVGVNFEIRVASGPMSETEAFLKTRRELLYPTT